ncbi:hypothetical protein HDU84_002797 [Entophlyctis sp. JEL0112]|nr:hypothetical protein HDU84_002797 [Entophlyctis sp. JEL0112]
MAHEEHFVGGSGHCTRTIASNFVMNSQSEQQDQELYHEQPQSHASANYVYQPLAQPKKSILKSHSSSLNDYAQNQDLAPPKYAPPCDTAMGRYLAILIWSLCSYADSYFWTEDNILITEAQKNSTMKITEPKTPFIHYNMSTDEIVGEVPPMQLTSALEYAAIQLDEKNHNKEDGHPNSSNSASSSASFMLLSESEKSIGESGGSGNMRASSVRSESGSDWDDDDSHHMTEEEREKHLRFERMRAQHYNMKYSLAEARKKLAEEEDDDDEDGEPDDRDDDEEDVDEEDDEESELTGGCDEGQGRTGNGAGKDRISAQPVDSAEAERQGLGRRNIADGRGLMEWK